MYVFSLQPVKFGAPGTSALRYIPKKKKTRRRKNRFRLIKSLATGFTAPQSSPTTPSRPSTSKTEQPQMNLEWSPMSEILRLLSPAGTPLRSPPDLSPSALEWAVVELNTPPGIRPSPTKSVRATPGTPLVDESGFLACFSHACKVSEVKPWDSVKMAIDGGPCAADSSNRVELGITPLALPDSKEVIGSPVEIDEDVLVLDTPPLEELFTELAVEDSSAEVFATPYPPTPGRNLAYRVNQVSPLRLYEAISPVMWSPVNSPPTTPGTWLRG